MNIDINLRNDKAGLLAYFRSRANEIASELRISIPQPTTKKGLSPEQGNYSEQRKLVVNC